MNICLKNRHFLKLNDFSKEEILYLVNLAFKLKQLKKNNKESKNLKNKNIVLIFEKTSTRTRCSFEVACFDQGAGVTFLESFSSQIGVKESIKDTARVLSRIYDAIEYRGFNQSKVEELAKYSKVPVINGLTNEFHPTQMLSDLMTMMEFSDKRLEEISFAYVGDAQNNIGNSILHLGAIMGMNVKIASPRFLWPKKDWIDYCKNVAKKSGARVLITESMDDAIRNVDFIYTDVWVSMGEEKSKWDERVNNLKKYRVDSEAILTTNNHNVKLMHCLPCYHNTETEIGKWVFDKFALDGVEVSDEVFEANSNIIFTQSENRLHTIKAVLISLIN